MERNRLIALIAGPALFLGLLALPTPVGLSIEAHRAMAVFALCIVWWFTTPVDLPVTALLGLALVSILGVLPAPEVFSYFGNQAIFFVIGVFLVAAVMMRTGLSARLALVLLSRLAIDEDRLAAGILVLATGLCSVIVSHAAAAILLPIVLDVLRALKQEHGSAFARRAVLSMAWGTVLGSNLTLLSSARASLALQLRDAHVASLGVDVSSTAVTFGSFVTASLPLVVLGFVPVYYVLKWAFPPTNVPMEPAVRMLRARVRELGPMQQQEKTTIAIVGIMVVAIVLFGEQYGLGSLALAISSLLFFFRVITWKEVERWVNWGVILLYGGTIALGKVLGVTGAAEWIVTDLLPLQNVSPWAFVAVYTWGAMILTELISNSGVVVLLLPIGLQVATQLGIDPSVLVFLTVFPTGMSCAMPTGTPAMAMVMGTGFVHPRDTVVRGVLMDHILWLILLGVAFFLWPLLGISLG